ncbi:glycolate oxidase subunit GlcE [Lichenihabitans sp. Uapishka_5]|uniref:glycolate oxidase subunit GlcE n=1 Tax=Lichenihabitans sp. Uapishka_5 TaxID=3037302 RepID=UPI0029E81544|nr:glycolate oxidase subunit GlcE [Lichenihabitans sp. Uapishka_5]MDX7952726.1 glycolate oxidase subunit GlcE [Lichenihabitans sp. Uapishka_5]
MTLLEPTSEPEVVAHVAAARQDRRTLSLRGGGTQVGLGRPVAADVILSCRALTGITLHEPAELVIAAWAGTPVAEVEAALASTGQILPFEPVDLRPLYGTAGAPTLGGVVAGNWSGPRRIQAGAARDHLIGVRFVNGRGEAIKSGGRVMKNVTGLDLVKLQCGAQGTLGVLTEVTFKVLPRPESTLTLAFAGLDDRRAVALLTAALGSPYEVSGAAHLPPGVEGAGARTLLRLEGFAASIAYRADQLATLLHRYGGPAMIEGDAAAALWAAVRDGRLLAEPRDRAVWRISVPPTQGPTLVDALRGRLAFAHLYDWGGGLIWLATAVERDAGATAIRDALALIGGHATLLRAPDAVRTRVPVFQPLAAPLAAVVARVKASLDPDLILNRGFMVAEG